MKALKVLAATAAMGALLATPAMADVSTDIYYNGTRLNTTQPVVNVDGRVLLAFRDLFENLDGEVSWSDEYRMAAVTYGKNTIQLFPDTGAVQVNGVPQALAVGPQIINDRVYLPLRFVAQSLGSTVDYTKSADDVGTIRINAIDSSENFVKTEGNLTTILRTTTDPVNIVSPTADTNTAYRQWADKNSVYFMDDHGNLVEVQSYDQKIQVNVIDLISTNVETDTYNTGILFPALTSVTRAGDRYIVGVNETTSSNRFVGVGTPTGTGDGVKVETDFGDLRMYSGQANNLQFRFDATNNTSAGVTTVNQTGLVLDLAQRTGGASQTSYAVAPNGNYAFLLDGELLIVQPDGTVKQEIILTSKIGDAKIFTMGNQFVIMAVDKDFLYPDLYAAVYNEDGTMAHYYHNIGGISRATDNETFYEYNNLKMIDMAVQGNRIYTLAKTDMDYYLITYDMVRNTSTKEQLSIKEKTYRGFLYTMDDVKLFSSDEDYFYLRDVN